MFVTVGSLSQRLWETAQSAAGLVTRLAGAVQSEPSPAILRQQAADKLYEIASGKPRAKDKDRVLDPAVRDVAKIRSGSVATEIVPAKSPVVVPQAPVVKKPPVEGKLVIAIEDAMLYEADSADAGQAPRAPADDRDMPMKKGKMWELIRRLLALNRHDPANRLVEVVIFSRGDSQSFRLDDSLDDPQVGLDIGRTFYVGADPIPPYLSLVGAHLMITGEKDAVIAATSEGLAAVHVPENAPPVPPIANDEAVVLSLDFDGVIGDRVADLLFLKEGLPAVREYDRARREEAAGRGPLFGYAAALTDLKRAVRQAMRANPEYRDLSEGEFEELVVRSEIKIAMVTARSGSLNGRRAKLTLFDPVLKRWWVACDRYFSLGHSVSYTSPIRLEKGPFLKLIGAHFHVDDAIKHVKNSIEYGIAAGHVAYPEE